MDSRLIIDFVLITISLEMYEHAGSHTLCVEWIGCAICTLIIINYLLCYIGVFVGHALLLH